MCIIFFAYKIHPQYKFVFAANRDEFYERPTKSAEFWSDYPDILAGRDLEKNGAWMGINKRGYFSAITNYRDFSLLIDEPMSRGNLVKDYLIENQSPKTYMDRVKAEKHRYNPFNLLVGHTSALYYYSNVDNEVKELKPGIYGLSNSLLDTPWPKLIRGKEMFKEIINSHREIDYKDLQNILLDKWCPEDDKLPNTGIELEWEKVLSSIFIESQNYGTRASTVLLIGNKNHVTFIEKSLKNSNTKEWNEIKYEFDIIR